MKVSASDKHYWLVSFGKYFIKSIYHRQERLLDRPPTARPGPT